MLKQLRRLFSRHHDTPADESSAKPTNARGARPSHASAPPAAAATLPSPDLNAEDVSIPLPAVLNNLPADLKSCVVPMELGGATLTVSLHKVLPQVPTGVVNLSFGVLRGAAPQLFSIGDVWDQRDIELPLNELLVRIHPALLPKPDTTDTTDNTDEASSALLLTAAPARSPESAPAKTSPNPIRVPLPANAPSPTPRAAAAATPGAGTGKAAATSPAREPLTIPLAALSGAWPATVRDEIARLQCTEALVAIPEPLLQPKMKQGKVTFHWQTVRGWLLPAPRAESSKHDNTLLDLPLEVIMPLFVSRLKQSPRAQSRVMVDESIPALFGPEANPEAPVTISDPKSRVTPTEPTPAATGEKAPGTDFKNRYLAPMETVERAAGFDGVAGALLVLPEGLPVAAKLATDPDPDALAAFLARAFGRVHKCAEEATLGELNHLNLILEDVPWQIYRLNGVLFAAYGWAGGTLPTPQLAALAGEFDRKK